MRSRKDVVGLEREIRVLLGRAERQHDAVVGLEVRLELHPVQIAHAHGAREDYGVVVVTVVAVRVVSVVVSDVVTVSVCVDAGPPETFIRTFEPRGHLLIRRRILGDHRALRLLRRHADQHGRRAPRPRSP